MGKLSEKLAPLTVAEACDKFIADAEAQNLREPTLYKYRLLFRQLQDFASASRLPFIADFDIDWVRRFRASWKNKNIAACKKLEAFRAFFRFVHEGSWIHTNPAVQLKPPRITAPPTVPFARGEVAEILKACENIQIRQIGFGYARLCSFLATAGCASVTLRRLAVTEFRNDKLFLYIAKTGTPVFCPLLPFVIEVLNAIPENTFFLDRTVNAQNDSGDQAESLMRLFISAGAPSGHAHRFRDTFLWNFCSQVSRLSGYQSS